MSEPKKLQVGDKAPAFTLKDSHNNDVSLSDYAGKQVVVYFYPKADTPGCTTEACDFQENLNEFNDAGIEVLGISPDPVDKLAAFRDGQSLTFPLLSDPDKSVMTAWGAFGEKKNYGKVVQGVIRSTFLVDTDGTIASAQYNVKATGHVGRVLRDVVTTDS